MVIAGPSIAKIQKVEHDLEKSITKGGSRFICFMNLPKIFRFDIEIPREKCAVLLI